MTTDEKTILESTLGYARIKPEFILRTRVLPQSEHSRHANVSDEGKECGKLEPGPSPLKRRRGTDKQRTKKMAEANHHVIKNTHRICPSVLFCPEDDVKKVECKFGKNCCAEHNRELYWEEKAADLDTECVIFNQRGFCQFGISCRFARSHTDKIGLKQHKKEASPCWLPTLNSQTVVLQQRLRKKQINFKKSERAVESLKEPFCQDKLLLSESVGAMCEEKRFLDMRSLTGKKYLAPLTTVGNLPFRRLCVDFGADVTCGEMAMATSLLQGTPSEWALIKRHPSERIFGVQLAGGYPDSLSKTVQLLLDNEQEGMGFDIDFLDLNLGCPLDLVVEKGGGCALANRSNKLFEVLRAMNFVAEKTPITLKMRYGMKEGEHTAHHLIKALSSGQKCQQPALLSLHPRSRDQRYSRAAEWNYVPKCAEAVGDRFPLFVCGDVFSYDQYYKRLEENPIDGIMIGRAALYKPWIFTEIDERRDWDISSQERLEVLQKFVRFGLEHWGSDNTGVETTRRFLLEWLSFLHRYIPVGLLEAPPQKINERPPFYSGRDELETLMASPRASDWVKLTEISGLGSVPDGFLFLPKHKASAY